MDITETGTTARTSIDEFLRGVADHGTYRGGGSVAAVTAAGAAALAELVLDLSRTRKANAAVSSEIASAVSTANASRNRLLQLADEDAFALDELLAAQAELRSSPDRSRYQAGLRGAAIAPMETAEACLSLLELIEAHMRRASRFTVSDLGAAGGLAFGALQGALMMSDINLALLMKEPNVDPSEINGLFEQSDALLAAGEQVAASIRSYTRSSIRKEEKRAE